MSNSDKYPILMRLMHWLVGLLILGIISAGWYMTGLEDSVSYKYDIYHWHKSFGMLVLFLLFARLVIRWASRVPPLPDTMPGYQKKLGVLVHWLLYLFMFLVPLSGFMMSNAGGRDVPFFNLTIPGFMEKNPELAGRLHDIHVVIPYVLLGIVVVHILAALKHRYFDKPEHDVLRRML
ncbi:cytochrome b [Endozoicomonas sp.]|uniref:cytochrome b n=1 Tax=Endozoicomonas sp. TaxID=1892382 RepID=UPI002883F989|nr:cytochrome b [Endozoicomonas sp.]